MDAQPAIEYITGADWRESRLGLERIAELMERLGSPQNGLRFVHVAGTNGKGSVSCMLAGILAEAGLRTGLFTSPYVTRFNERMQINGRQITDEELARLAARVRRCAAEMADHPTEFELVCAIGFLWFAEMRCQMVVLEVGLGGRLDATNVIETPQLAVITTIDYDHTQQLGDTLPKIAAEKAGIIKPGGRVLLYPQPPRVEAVFRKLCVARGVRLVPADFSSLRLRGHGLLGQTFDYGGLNALNISLLGPYQPKNAALAVSAARLLAQGGLPLSDAAIRRGLAAARWPARFELVHTQPAVIVDGGHNPQCVRELAKGLGRYFAGQKLVFLAGVMADKAYGTMFRTVLPLAREVVCVAPDNPRALPAETLAEFLRGLGLRKVRACAGLRGGIEAALAASGGTAPVCAFGSFYMAGEIREYFLKKTESHN